MNTGDIEAVFQSLTIRRMFGGKGIYHFGRIVAIELMLKADAITAPKFAAAGAKQWVYPGKKGTDVKMPYCSIPLDAFDDPDEMAIWVRLAYGASLRAK